MKANEFVKKFGLEHTKYLIEDTELSEFAIHLRCGGAYFDDTVDAKDLKCLVESHELVGNFGGIKRAKRILKKAYTSFNTQVSVVWNDKPFQCIIQKLEQSIADVESCL